MDKNIILGHIKKGIEKAKKKDKKAVKASKEDYLKALYELEMTVAWSIANNHT
jgi:hypothetical protein